MDFSTISCDQTPHDLRFVARRVVDGALAVRDPSKRPILVMGELHDYPSHRLLMQAVLKDCSERGLKTALHFEYDHNFLTRIAQTRVGLPFHDEGAFALAKLDPQGDLLVKAALCYNPFRYSSRTAQNLLAFCHDKKISAVFTDAAKTKFIEAGRSRFLDPKDPETKVLIGRFSGSEDSQIDIESSQGIELRNMMMVQKTYEALERHKADIVVHHCGREHVFGDVRYGFSYASSLSAQFKDRGFHVTSVFPDHRFASDNIPEEALRDSDLSGILVQGLPDVLNQQREADELESFRRASQGYLEVYNPEDLISRGKWRTKVRQGLESALKRIPKL